jgi:uncharacterized protein YbgA (DUF1722 family)/uncharacterized protein YbbK (DUF523 family)
MTNFPKPVIVVSKCLGFERCRWNGEVLPDKFVEKLKPFVEYKPVCAEVEIGLGVPRDPIRVVSDNGELRLVQPATGREVSAEMRSFAEGFMNSLGAVDGFILKSRSPSCGVKDVRVYPSAGKSASIATSAGFFGAAALAHFPDLPIEDEGRLSNYRLREHFLTSIFMLARFRAVKTSGALGQLVRFQAENKYLLLSYHQQEMRALGRIVANLEKKPLPEVFAAYEQHLRAALAHPPRCGAAINVLMHGMGYFSEELSGAEKSYFLESLEQYRAGKLPLSAPIAILKGHGVRFSEEYLMQQTFFRPYPEALVEMSDSGKDAACLLPPDKK